MSQPNNIFLADLTHTGVSIAANTFPLGCGFIAAYCLQELGDEVAVELFRYPAEFSESLERTVPAIAGFSNYSWCLNLHYGYAERVKAAHPDTVIVFGGPNYPVDREQQEVFLRERPAIDFYVDGEGEVAFVALYRLLKANGFSADKVKALPLPAGVHCVAGGRFHSGPPQMRIPDVSVIPSPYLMGLMDKFFDPALTPLMQTSRGCPYSCGYCHEGIDSMNKLARFPQERINAEIVYIMERHKVPMLSLADSNFGIFKEDLETARLISSLRQKTGWPHFFDASAAKHAKQRIIEIGNLLKGSLWVGAAVQSTDDEVLENVKRRNVPRDQMIELAKTSASGDGFSEVILNLPGDTAAKHQKSVLDMLDLDMDEVRMYQFVLLPGTEAANEEYRRRFAYDTRWRVLPRCFGRYKLYGKEFSAFEYHEVCIGSSTMSTDDYKACRVFNLIVEIFNNGGVLREVFAMLRHYGISRSRFIDKASRLARENEVLKDIFARFAADEEKNFHQGKEAIETFLERPDTIDRYISGEMGTNQIFTFRSLIYCQHFDIIVQLADRISRELLAEISALSPEAEEYISDLMRFVMSVKGDLLSLADIPPRRYGFDFVRLAEDHFMGDPLAARVEGGVDIAFVYDDGHRNRVAAYYEQFGRDLKGFANYLQRGGPLGSLFRKPVRTDHTTRPMK